MPPKNYQNFPSKKEREELMEQLRQMEQREDALTANEHYINYIASLKTLNETMDHYYTADGDGNVPPLEQDGKDKLMQYILITAKLGETFLADVERQGGSLTKGSPGLVGRVQSMMSQDYETLSLYDPESMELTLPEIQQDARTKVVDLRGVSLGKMGNMQSSRIPMTVVDETGKKRGGVFTKASHVSVAKPFREMLKKVSEECRNPKEKQEIENMISTYRDYLQKNQEGKTNKIHRLPGGLQPKDAGDEMIAAKMIQHLSWSEVKLDDLLKHAGVSPDNSAWRKLRENMTKQVEPSAWVNALELGLKEGDRIDQRNSAMSAVANLLGVSRLVARSTNMKCLDEDGNEVEGTFMEKAEGLDLVGKDNEELFEQVSDEPFEQESDLSKDIADLQILDYICGNIDRHAGNLFYKVDEKTGKITGVQGIDNDSAFGLYSAGKDGRRFRLTGTDSLTVVSEDMAKKVSGISPEMLKFTLRGRGLTEQEIQAACGRLNEVKEAVKERVPAKGSAELMQNKGLKKLSVMSAEAMRKLPPTSFGSENGNLFRLVADGIDNHLQNAREQGYGYAPEKKSEEKSFREVSTTSRRFTAAGIGESLRGMSRMIQNEVTGFVVTGLSKLFRSSDKWRTMVASVKAADQLSAQLKKDVGEKGALDREDPKVKAQLEKADKAMAKVEKATQEYLAKKMKEKKVESLDLLRGKNAYEQKRIDYAKKLMENVKEYNQIAHPEKAEAQAEKDAVKGRAELSAQRQEKQQAPQLGAV